MTEIDHDLTKHQIAQYLRLDTTLFDVNAVNETKFSYLKVGEPNGTPLPIPSTYPALWITNSRSLETITRKGITDSNQHTFLTHEVRYMLKFMVNEQDSIAAEKRLDDLHKLTMERLKTNVGLTGILFDAWVTATNYDVGDLVSDASINYQCILNHVSAAGNKPPNATNWKVLDVLLPDDSWPERAETFRMELDGTPVKGQMITWHYLFTTS